MYESETDKLIKSFKRLCNLILICWFFSLAWNALVAITPLRLFFNHAWPRGVFYWFQGFFVMICFGIPTTIVGLGLFYTGSSWGATNDELLMMGLMFSAVFWPVGLLILKWMDNKYYGTGLYQRYNQTGF